MTSIIRTENLTKAYGKVIANKNITMEIEGNTVHAIVGENGAGKSTFVTMLYGIIMKTSGKIFIKGKEVNYTGSKEAIEAGIGMVNQHFRLIPELTVTENIILGDEPGSKFYLNRKEAAKTVKKLSEEFGLAIDPNSKIKDVSVGQQQRVEILKALYRKSEILILDEPTAVLTPQEIDDLGIIIKKLKERGMTIIIITHKLKEVMDFTDNITVFRQGEKIGDLITKNTSSSEITEMMVGRGVTLGGKTNRENTKCKEIALEVKNVNHINQRGKRIKDINLHVKKGEIVGIAGVDGSGQGQLLNLISGIEKIQKGSISMNGKVIDNMTIRERRNNSFGYIPQDRHKEGLILEYTIEENLILGLEESHRFKKKFNFLKFKNINKNAKEKIEKNDIRASSEKVKAGTLSGGNQQKIIIAREAGENPDFILVAQPTRGLDIGAIEFVHDTLIDLRNNNKGVLVVSFELDELLVLCDRIIVMCAGEITGDIDSKDFDKEKIGLMMIGKVGEENE